MFDIQKPDVRKWFIPDPGFTIFDADLQQADAQVVAWEADDDELKAIFRDPTADLHDENCKTLFNKLTPHGRKLAKAGVHATNYYVKPPTLARTLGITVKLAEAFINRWFSAHPGIKEWQERIQNQLNTTKEISNAFGFKRRFYGRVENLLPEALGWIPQSTVARVINEGLNNLEEHAIVVPNIQVHDSVVGQFPHNFYPRRDEIRKNMEIIVPYDDPLIIGVDIECSKLSWGDCKRVPWQDNYAICPH